MAEENKDTQTQDESGNQNQATERDNKLAELYDKLAHTTRVVFEESSDKTLAALEAAIEKSRHGLEKAGELSKQESGRLKDYLRKDLEHAATRMNELKDQTKEKLEPSVKKAEDSFLNLTASLAHSASDALGRLAEWADSAAAYHTGQVTSPGTLQCLHCKKEMNFKKTGNIPPCPSCHKTDFKKIR